VKGSNLRTGLQLARLVRWFELIHSSHRGRSTVLRARTRLFGSDSTVFGGTALGALSIVRRARE
jgi:hypothetical protein